MQKIISISLSLFLLMGTTGIAYSQHFCGGHLVESVISFGEIMLDCGMENESGSCNAEMEENSGLPILTCCDDQFHQIEVDDNYNGAQFSFEFQTYFLASFASVFVLNNFEAVSTSPEIAHYYPPPIDKEVQILYQVFLI